MHIASDFWIAAVGLASSVHRGSFAAMARNIVSPTVRKFPSTPACKDRSGVLWGCTVTPFQQTDGVKVFKPGHTIRRCEECFAYVNPQCAIRARTWTCSLCGYRNHGSDAYWAGRGAWSDNTSTAVSAVEVPLPLTHHFTQTLTQGDSGGGREEAAHDLPVVYECSAQEMPPVYLAMVDVSGDMQSVEAVANALSETIANAPAHARFGLISFSDKVKLYDVNPYNSDVTHAMTVPLGRIRMPTVEEEMAGATPTFVEDNTIALGNVLSLEALTVSVGEQFTHEERLYEARKSITQALRGLAEDCAREVADRAVPVQCFGAVVRRVVDLLLSPESGCCHASVNEETGVAATITPSSVRVLCFLNSPANYGPGAVTRPLGRRRQQQQQQQHNGGGGGSGRDGSGSGINSFSSVNRGLDFGIPKTDTDAGKSVLDFYTAIAEEVGMCGISFDLFSVAAKAEDQVGMPLIAPLALLTGGNVHRIDLWWTSRKPEQRLADTLQNIVHRAVAHRSTLRVRSTSEFKVSEDETYGGAVIDEDGGSLDSGEPMFHIACCDPDHTLAFGFDFRSPSGHSLDMVPVMQIAFAYTCIVARERRQQPRQRQQQQPRRSGDGPPKAQGAEGDAGWGDDAAVPSSVASSSSSIMRAEEDMPADEGAGGDLLEDRYDYVVVRRLRIVTVPFQYSDNPRKVQLGMNLEPALALLCHKMVIEVGESGLEESRLLLQDWLTRLLLSVASNVTSKNTKPQLPSPSLDGSVNDIINILGDLHMIFPFVHGLLVSDFFGESARESDSNATLEALLCSYTPNQLRKHVYPDLICVKTLGLVDDGSSSSKSTSAPIAGPEDPDLGSPVWGSLTRLSREAIAEAHPKALFLDAQHTVCVYYPWETIQAGQQQGGTGADKAQNLFPFPPPDDCEVMAEAQARKFDTRHVPSIVLARAGASDACVFEDGLVEDKSLPKSMNGMTYRQLCEYVVREAAEVLRES